MKKIMTKERLAGLPKNDEAYLNMAEEAYQEVLNIVSEAIGPTSLSDEPILCAAFEDYAKKLKERMAERELKIYERVRTFDTTGFEIKRRKTEE